ncbi:dipicolinate synthase [Pantoea vagans]|uniref:helix-turn-helix transcriptional regulator n=1 Tax=Pantoea vagans TaxID=470934 RepID=UPI000BACC6FB|nr:AlpA family transcriptional regulator [Pantoea vagans]PAW34900.1 dipicolinate synthase [Pantoea vagans]
MKNSSIRLIRMPEVLSKTGFKKSWIYLLISNNSFPKSIKMGPRSVAFVEAEIDQWILERINGSRNYEVKVS